MEKIGERGRGILAAAAKIISEVLEDAPLALFRITSGKPELIYATRVSGEELALCVAALTGSPRDALRDLKGEALRLFLEDNRWNVSRTARRMGVTRRTVYDRLDKAGIPRRRAGKGSRIPE